jgi:hypothetical protein
MTSIMATPGSSSSISAGAGEDASICGNGGITAVSDEGASSVNVKYPKALWKSLHRNMDVDQLNDFYCEGRLYHSLPASQLRGPSFEESSRFRLEMCAIKSKIQEFTRSRVVEWVVEWAIKKN